MLAKPISISVLLHLLFVVIIITGLPSFDRLEESPMSIVEIELINNLPAITQEIIEDDTIINLEDDAADEPLEEIDESVLEIEFEDEDSEDSKNIEEIK